MSDAPSSGGDSPLGLPVFAIPEEELREMDPSEQKAIRRLQRGPAAYAPDFDSDKETICRIVKATIEVTRKEAMAKAGDLFFKLAHPLRCANQDLRSQVEAWISDHHIALLDEENRNLLWLWCNGNLKSWAEKIKALPESFPFAVQRDEELDLNMVNRLKGQLWQQLDVLSKISDQPDSVRNWISSMRLIANAEAGMTGWYMEYVALQARIANRQQSQLKANISNLQEAITSMLSVPRNTNSPVHRLTTSPEPVSRGVQRKRRRTITDSGDTGERYKSAETSDITDAQFNALMVFLDKIDYEGSEGFAKDVKELCVTIGMSKKQVDEAMSQCFWW